MDTVLSPKPTELAFSFRNAPQANLGRCKLIEWAENQSVAMIITLTEDSEQDMDISVEMQPTNGQSYLPANLQLMVLNEDGEAVMDVQAGSDNKTMQLEFSGEEGDYFGIKVVLGDSSVTENFMI